MRRTRMQPAAPIVPPGARLVHAGDDEYPDALREIYDPPAALWVLGGFTRADARAVAIVGSRKASPYGIAVAERLGRELAALGLTVVSGLAIGVDGAAHRGALEAGGRTIAVLGSGIDHVYPNRHRKLAAEIAAGRGAVVSELPPGTAPLAWHFPRRNRIVAGLCRAVVVVEASEKSGSLITARLAAEEGRDVYGVPGEAGLERTRGVHRLLKQGAGILEGAEDLLAGSFPDLLESRPKTRQTRRFSDDSPGRTSRLLACFGETVVAVDELIERSGLPTAEVLELLLDLEIAGRVVRHPGPAYSLKVK